MFIYIRLQQELSVKLAITITLTICLLIQITLHHNVVLPKTMTVIAFDVLARTMRLVYLDISTNTNAVVGVNILNDYSIKSFISYIQAPQVVRYTWELYL